MDFVNAYCVAYCMENEMDHDEHTLQVSAELLLDDTEIQFMISNLQGSIL